MFPRSKKKEHETLEILTDALKCIEGFTSLVENLTIIINVHITTSKQLSQWWGMVGERQ